MAAARYWCISGIETSGASSDLTLHGINMYESSSLQSGTLTCPISPTAGALSNLTDSDIATSATFSAADVALPGFSLTWDFTTAKDISEIRFTAGSNSDAFIANFIVQSSSDAVTWTIAVFIPSWMKLSYPGALIAAAVPITDDPYRSCVVLHLHCNGTDASSTITDSSISNHTFTASGNAKISTAQSKFNGSSLMLDGTGDWVQTTTDLSDFALGPDDFTVESLVKTTDTNCCIVDFYGTNGWQILISSSGYLQWYPASGSVKTGSITVNNDTWNHVAVVRNAGRLYLFVNGVLDGTSTLTTTNYSGLISTFAVGAQVASRNGTFDLSGYVNEVRITKGVGRYAANFTPAAASFLDTNISVSQASVKSTTASPIIIIGSSAIGDTQITAPAVATISDMQDGGLYRVTGTVKEKATPSNTPLKRKVRLHREKDGRMIRETWSDASTGEYTFNYIRGDATYFVTTFDYLHNYRAVIADNLTAELMP